MLTKLLNRIRPVAGQWLPPIVTSQIKRRLSASPYRLELVAKSISDTSTGGVALREAREHLDFKAGRNRAVHGLPASPRWETMLDRMRDDIMLFDTAGEAIIFAQTRIDFDHREPVSTAGPLFRLHADTLKNEFPQLQAIVDELGDSSFSRPDSLLPVKNRLVSNVLFWHLSMLLQCLARVPKLDSICEIGGGYGALTRLWTQNSAKRPKTIVIIDFPESLFFAEVFLKINFEGLRLHYVADTAALARAAAEQYQVILCPIQHLEALNQLAFDLVINTGSMGEMTDEWVDFWMAWLRRQEIRFFYSLNYFAQPLTYMAEGGNAWSPRLTPEWTARLLRANPPFFMQQTTRNFGEMLAEKTGAAGPAPASSLAARYEQLRDRFLTNQTFLECMDIVRQNPGEEIVWDLVQRVAQLPTVPKEAFHLAQSLVKNGSGQFRAKHGTESAAIFAQFQRLRASGRENTYSA